MEKVKSINFASIYVDDYQKAFVFYQKHFGFEVKHRMGENASWGKAGDAAIYLEGGNSLTDFTDKSVRTSVVFNVESASKFFNQLTADGVITLQSEPQNMGADDYWFQFRDPAGNILEVLGGL
jgi:predicted enzyme related to lactoylglutathione lyase